MNDVDLKGRTILVVDDDQRNTMLLQAILQQAGYTKIVTLNDALATLAAFRREQPDLLVLDHNMPGMSGFEVMRALTALIPAGEYFPIIMITADLSREVKLEALALGAKDFLHKPIDQAEVRLRIQNLLETRVLHQRLKAYASDLECKVRERTADLELAHLDTLRRLAKAAEYRDDVTGDHTRRMGETAACIAREIGWSPAEVELIRLAAPLHDVGKIGIPDRILLKPGRLTPEEFEVMKTHVTIGAALLSGSRAPVLQMAEAIAHTHHERWDGTGYLRMAGTEIPMASRIVALADVFDGLTHERPYKPAWPIERARQEILQQVGRHFDPALVEVFIRIVDREGLRLIQAPPPDALAA